MSNIVTQFCPTPSRFPFLAHPESLSTVDSQSNTALYTPRRLTAKNSPFAHRAKKFLAHLSYKLPQLPFSPPENGIRIYRINSHIAKFQPFISILEIPSFPSRPPIRRAMTHFATATLSRFSKPAIGRLSTIEAPHSTLPRHLSPLRSHHRTHFNHTLR
jgi:hypothetical protein